MHGSFRPEAGVQMNRHSRRRVRSRKTTSFAWGPWLFWSLWVILLSGLTTISVLLIWESRNPCPCSAGEIDSVAFPTLEPTSSQPMFPYVVEPGETLEDVAQRFGVPVPTLQAVNRLPPEHSLQPGQLLFIPGTPPASEAQEERVRIVEVLGIGLLEQERVRLTNLSPQPISLEGWTLVDQDGHEFRFPAILLYAQGSLFLWTKAGVNTAVDVYWGLTEAVWEPGETAILRNAQGQEIHRFDIP